MFAVGARPGFDRQHNLRPRSRWQGNSRVGVDIERQANCFDQDRETFGSSDDQAGLLAAAVDVGKAHRTAFGRALFSPPSTASRSVQSPMNFGLKRAVRGRGMKRCLAEGAERFTLFVGAAVLANNLMIVAGLLAKRYSRRRKATR
jgi:hypothetical protein